MRKHFICFSFYCESIWDGTKSPKYNIKTMPKDFPYITGNFMKFSLNLPSFHVFSSARFLGNLYYSESPSHGEKSSCPSQYNLHHKENQIQAKHDAGC